MSPLQKELSPRNAMSDTPRTDLMEKVAQPYSWQASYIRAADFARELERENAKLREQLAKSETYIRKMDGILEEVGGVTVSCINPYEDIKRSLLSLKTIRDGKRHALRQ